MASAKDLQFTPIDNIPKLVQEARNAFNAGKTRSLEARKKNLQALFHLLEENKSLLTECLQKDLHKHPVEGTVMEIALLQSDIVESLDHLDEWTKPYYPKVDFLNKFDNCQVRNEPLGVVLIIGAWNYPIQLVLLPMIGAIAAGNCVIVKPSEVSVNSARVLADLFDKYLDKECFKIINGAVNETTVLLEQRFDHIFYTGNSNVAKIIMSAASKFLTPVTLELGGKSPCIIDKNADIKITARRVMWGRFINCGQTCIAPDYILCEKSVQDNFIEASKEALKEFFGEDPQKSNDYGRIVNANHFKRVKSLLSSGKVAIGGKVDESDLYISPTVLVDVPIDSPAMQSEIFGPVLPIVNIKNVDEAIQFINAREKPLALYLFSNNKEVVNKVLGTTSSGGACVNDTLMHVSVPALPFGGVGNSGMGAYHGKHTFDTFSHKRGVMIKSLGLESLNGLRYPPYTEKKYNILSKLLFKKMGSNKGLPYFKIAIAVLFFGFIYAKFSFPSLSAVGASITSRL